MKIILIALLQLSLAAAEGVQQKIELMKKKDVSKQLNSSSERAEFSETEFESYILFLLRDKIPATLDAVDVQCGAGTIASDVRLTLGSATTGNFIVDRIIAGNHKLFVKGKFTGAMGRGKFELESVYVDRIPVPVFLAEAVFNTFVKPIVPAADIQEPFELPFGIDILNILPGKVIAFY